MSDTEDELLERPRVDKDVNVPILDRIVQTSKQKDLADLLIKIIQTNEAEDKDSLNEYGADVSTATLRDIDAKLNEALSKLPDGPSTKAIPLLTQIADHPRSGKQNNAQDGSQLPPVDFPLPLDTHQVANDTLAANSSAPQSANQEYVQDAPFTPVDAQADAKEFDLGLDSSQLSRNQQTLLQHELQQQSRQIINELVDRHALAIRAELEQHLDALKQTLLRDVTDSQDS